MNNFVSGAKGLRSSEKAGTGYLVWAFMVAKVICDSLLGARFLKPFKCGRLGSSWVKWAMRKHLKLQRFFRATELAYISVAEIIE